MNEHETENQADADYIEKVRRRAHAIWMDEGQVHGRDQEHWHQAETEIAAETGAHTAPETTAPQETSQESATSGGDIEPDTAAAPRKGGSDTEPEMTEPQESSPKAAASSAIADGPLPTGP